MKKKISFLLVFFVIALVTFAQSQTVTGNVIEASTNMPMPGVSVKVEGTTTATSTNLDGNYSIVANKGDVLKFSFLGMRTVTVKVSSDGPINVEMKDDNVLLDQIVVIGYGTVKKSDLTGAVASIKGSDLMADVSMNAASALQGKVPGVAVTSTSGAPGQGMSITVRGVSSLTNNDPLYIIDGVYGDINLIDPSEIASIEVLKDASAAAIYGSRAASGVVIVSTKTGRKNTPAKIDLNLYAGVQQVSKKLDVMNAAEWTGFLQKNGHQSALDGSDYAKAYKGGKGTNWQDELYQSAAVYKANLGISGGSENAIYSSSIGYLSQEGIMVNTKYESFNARFKNEFSFLNDKLKIGQSIIFKSGKATGYADHSNVQEALRVPSIVPVRDANRPLGGWGSVENWMENMGNPVGAAYTNSNYGDDSRRTMDVLFNAYLQAELYDGLKYKLNFGYDQSEYNNKGMRGVFDFRSGGSNAQPDLKESNSNYRTWLLENTLNYDKTFGKHTVAALLGYSAQKNTSRGFGAERLDLPLGTNVISAGSALYQSTSGWQYRDGILSAFGRLMYSYDSRYMLSASVRRDGSSKFADGYRWGSFPSFSLGWNIHNESFAAGLKNVVDELKLRVSYGKLGNSQIPDFRTQRTLSSGMNYVQGNSWWIGNITGAEWVSPYDLTWETTETTNFGLDATFLGGKLSFLADAYIQDTKDVLMPISMPGSTGLLGDPIMNAGTIRNKGFEMAVTHRNNVGKVYYSLTGNMSTVSNKVRKITVGGKQEDIPGYTPQGLGDITWFKVGEPMGVFRVIKTDGIFQNTAEVDEWIKKYNINTEVQPRPQPGDIRFVDINGDGVINNEDRQTVGKPIPDVAFGLRGSVEWNGFDMNFFFDGMVGNSIYNFPKWRLENMNNSFANYSKDVLGAWTSSNPSNKMPRWTKGDDKGDINNNSRVNSDRWIEKGDFLRLKTLEIGYSVPKSIVNKFNLDRLRVYTAFENLFTITGYSGYTPDVGYMNAENAQSGYEALSRGCDHGRYPQARTFSFGIQIGL